MQVRNMRQQSLSVHNFAMNPRAQVQRSAFTMQQGHKTAFPASYLIPVQVEEVMPGDKFDVRIDVVARTAVPIVPIQDNWTMDLFSFFVPTRIVWPNWEKMLGAQANPGDSISYSVPQSVSGVGGYQITSTQDYMGLPTVGQVGAGNIVGNSALPLRCYNKIYNDWFRDENLQASAVENTGNGPDLVTDFPLRKRGKRADYFTKALPFVQKGTAVTMPLGSSAPVVSDGNSPIFWNPGQSRQAFMQMTNAATTNTFSNAAAGSGNVNFGVDGTGSTGLRVNLTAASAASINTMRTAAATQQLLEADARGGTRYVETVYAHWGVRPPDYRLDRPEYIGGGQVRINVDAIPQTSATGLTGGTTPAGNLAATGWASGKAGYSYAATEHGYIITLANVRADLTYSQGMRRFWNRVTRFDFPYPEFAHLGEQAILNQEIYATGAGADSNVFGYIPRYEECRHWPSMITGLMRPNATGNIGYWHSSQLFSALPTLNDTFIQDPASDVLARNFAAGALANSQQFICDFMFSGRVARPLPTYSKPGLTRF